MILIAELINHFVNGIANNLNTYKMKVKKAQAGKMVAGEMTGKMYKKSAIDKIGDKQAKELDKASVLGKKAMAKAKPKAKSGGAFGMLSVKAGIDKNPNPTQADRIAGAKGMAKSGKKVAKKMMKSGGTVSMQLGSYKGVIGKNTKGKATKAVGLTKAKYGKSMGKCKSGC
jgi:hypothetical protein